MDHDNFSQRQQNQNDDRLLEPFTPYAAVVLVLCRHVIEEANGSERAMDVHVKAKLATLLVQLTQNNELSFNVFCARLKAALPPAMYESYRKCLGAMETSDEVISQDLFAFCAAPLITESSFLGVRVRKLCLAFNQLQESYSSIMRFESEFFSYIGRNKQRLLSEEEEEDDLDYEGGESCSHLLEGDSSMMMDETNEMNAKSGTSAVPDIKIPDASSLNGHPPSKSIQQSAVFDARVTQSNTKALKFINRQIDLLYTRPWLALSSDDIEQSVCSIRKHMPGLFEAYRLRAVNAVRDRDFDAANAAVHDYYDWSCVQALNGGSDLDEACRRHNSALRYAPLMVANICRQFGFRQEAIHALHACVQTAHEYDDALCIKHALSEMCTLDTEKPEELMKMIELAINDTLQAQNSDALNEQSSRVCLSLRLLHARALYHRALLNCTHRHDDKSSRELQSACATLQYGDSEVTVDNQAHVSTVVGSTVHSHKVLPYVNSLKAMLTSLYLAEANIASTVLSAQQLLTANTQGHMTNAHAIAVANMAYAHALKGEYSAAKQLLQSVQDQIGPSCSQSVQTVLSTCMQSVCFDQSLFAHDVPAAKKHLEAVTVLDAQHARFKNVVYLLSVGDQQTALIELLAMRTQYETGNAHAQMLCRVLLLLSTVYNQCNQLGYAMDAARKCELLAQTQCMPHMTAAVTVKLTALMIARKCTVEAGKMIDSLRPSEHSLLPIDRAQFTLLRAIHALNTSWCTVTLIYTSFSDDSNECLSLTRSAIEQFRVLQTKSLLKFALKMAALVSAQVDLVKERNQFAHEYKQLDPENLVPSHCAWADVF